MTEKDNEQLKMLEQSKRHIQRNMTIAIINHTRACKRMDEIIQNVFVVAEQIKQVKLEV